MSRKHQALGWLIFLVCVVVAIWYTVALAFPNVILEWVSPTHARLWLIGVPVFIAFIAITAIGAFIGWIMATTPPPKPTEEFETEDKIEEGTGNEV